MNRWGRSIGVIAAIIVLAVLMFVAAPRIGGWTQAYLIKPSAAMALPKEDTSKAMGDFLASLKTAEKYSIAGTKKVAGVSSPYSMDFACAVSGADYAVQTVLNGNTLRQIYKGGKYTLLDDTSKKSYKDVLYIDIPDSHIKEALNGRLIRSRGEILNGNQTTCIEFYKDGRVYAFYLNQQGTLVRYYYIYEGSEVTIDFTKAVVGSSSGVSFDLPAGYTAGDSGELLKSNIEPQATQSGQPQTTASSAPSAKKS